MNEKYHYGNSFHLGDFVVFVSFFFVHIEVCMLHKCDRVLPRKRKRFVSLNLQPDHLPYLVHYTTKGGTLRVQCAQTETLCTKGLVTTIFTEPSNWTVHKKVTIEIKVDLDCLERWIGRKMELTLCRYAILFSVVTLLYCLRIHITYYLERFFSLRLFKTGWRCVCVCLCVWTERETECTYHKRFWCFC